MRTALLGLISVTVMVVMTQELDDRQLIVLSAPSVHNEYYSDDFEAIVEFQKQYARTVIGNDDVIIVVDRDTKPYYANTLPEDILLEATIEDIWIRDFSASFTYDPSYFERYDDAEFIQTSFIDFADTYDITYRLHDYVLDGGNMVDNGKGKLITTTRFLEENDLEAAEGKEILKMLTDASEVAIIEYDDKVMGHADGMVMWSDEDTLFVNRYDEPFRTSVLEELNNAFTDVSLIEVPTAANTGRWRAFNSACGVHLNSVVTSNHIYVPTFNQQNADSAALKIIRANTSKTVHTIPAQHVCHMGGSVRCLSWQVSGKQARILIEAAKMR